MIYQTETFSPVTLTLAKVSPLSEADMEALERIVHRKFLSKNSELLRIGQVSSYYMYAAHVTTPNMGQGPARLLKMPLC